jgi:hypothetical protein
MLWKALVVRQGELLELKDTEKPNVSLQHAVARAPATNL